jgi:chemotaxis protein MotB
MMALFMVMWLMASSEQVKKSIAAYFLDPKGSKSQIGGAGSNGSGKSIYLSIDEMKDLKQKLEQSLRSLPAIEKLKDQITMTITGEGLRIELLENSKGVFFETGNAQPTSTGEEAVSLLATELGKLPNAIVLEGHTDAATYNTSKTYTNWELSADRANEARRLMQAHGVRQDQIKQIRGYGDQNLRNAKNPLDPSNRRISVIVLYGEQPGAEAVNKGSVKGASAGSKVAAEVVAISPAVAGTKGAPAAAPGKPKK